MTENTVHPSASDANLPGREILNMPIGEVLARSKAAGVSPAAFLEAAGAAEAFESERADGSPLEGLAESLPLDEIREWGIVVRHLLAEHGAPILSTGDRRFASFGGKYPERMAGDHYGALLAEDWFWEVFDQRPAFPWDGPAWSNRTPRYAPGGHEEVQVIFERLVESPGATARVQLLVLIEFETGSVSVDQGIEIQSNRDGENDFSGSVDDARAHIAALSAVLSALSVSGGVVSD